MANTPEMIYDVYFRQACTRTVAEQRNETTSGITRMNNQFHLLNRGLTSDTSSFAIFDERLLLETGPLTVKEQIADLIRSSPPSADLLHLQACHERCRMPPRAQQIPPALTACS